jgi:hypothetical protein
MAAWIVDPQQIKPGSLMPATRWRRRPAGVARLPRRAALTAPMTTRRGSNSAAEATGHPVDRLERGNRKSLNRTWAQPTKGFIGWFMPVNQRVIGKRFIVTAFVFFILAGIQAARCGCSWRFPNTGCSRPSCTTR